jgi:hypothetical protein
VDRRTGTRRRKGKMKKEERSGRTKDNRRNNEREKYKRRHADRRLTDFDDREGTKRKKD